MSRKSRKSRNDSLNGKQPLRPRAQAMTPPEAKAYQGLYQQMTPPTANEYQRLYQQMTFTAFTQRKIDVKDCSKREYVETKVPILWQEEWLTPNRKQQLYKENDNFKNALSLATYDGLVTGTVRGVPPTEPNGDIIDRRVISQCFADALIYMNIMRQSDTPDIISLEIKKPNQVILSVTSQLHDIANELPCVKIEQQYEILKDIKNQTFIYSKVKVTFDPAYPIENRRQVVQTLKTAYDKQQFHTKPDDMRLEADRHFTNDNASLMRTSNSSQSLMGKGKIADKKEKGDNNLKHPPSPLSRKPKPA